MKPTIRPDQSDEAVINSRGPAAWNHYPIAARKFFFWFEDDWGYSFPGWFADCGIGALLHRCMVESTTCTRALKLNYPHPKFFIHVSHGPSTYNIYRDTFSNEGFRICQQLQKNGEVNCPASRDEGWHAACKRMSKMGTFRDLTKSSCFQCSTVTEDCAGNCEPGVCRV